MLFLVTRTLASGLRLYLAAVVLRAITGWSLPVSIVVIGLSTLAYTYFGGIKAVVWIDVFQFAVYLVAAGVALGILLGRDPRRLGGDLAAGVGGAQVPGDQLRLRRRGLPRDLGEPAGRSTGCSPRPTPSGRA